MILPKYDLIKGIDYSLVGRPSRSIYDMDVDADVIATEVDGKTVYCETFIVAAIRANKKIRNVLKSKMRCDLRRAVRSVAETSNVVDYVRGGGLL